MSGRADLLANLRGALSNGGPVVMLTRHTACRLLVELETSNAAIYESCAVEAEACGNFSVDNDSAAIVAAAIRALAARCIGGAS